MLQQAAIASRTAGNQRQYNPPLIAAVSQKSILQDDADRDVDPLLGVAVRRDGATELLLVAELALAVTDN
jgi:hypothetical protein